MVWGWQYHCQTNTIIPIVAQTHSTNRKKTHRWHLFDWSFSFYIVLLCLTSNSRSAKSKTWLRAVALLQTEHLKAMRQHLNARKMTSLWFNTVHQLKRSTQNCWQLFGSDQLPGYMKFNDLWTFNGRSWSKILSDAPWEVRSGLCAVILPNKILGIFGGNGRYVQEPWPPMGIHVPCYALRFFNDMCDQWWCIHTVFI